VSLVDHLVGMHRPCNAFFVPDQAGSSIVVVSEGVFAPSLDAVSRFVPASPTISPLVRLPSEGENQRPDGDEANSAEEVAPPPPQKDWSEEMSMHEMAEVINARLEMETDDIDFGSSEYFDEELAGVRCTQAGMGTGGSTATWGIYRYSCPYAASNRDDSTQAIRLTHVYSLGSFSVMGFEDISPTEKYILVKCDVDCLVYQLSFDVGDPGAVMSLRHVDVFGGLAYIEAGKRYKKATLVSPTRSHAIIIEGARFIYIYHHAPPGAPKSVHSILEDDSAEDILGWQFVDAHHFAFLTKSKLEVHVLD